MPAATKLQRARRQIQVGLLADRRVPVREIAERLDTTVRVVVADLEAMDMEVRR